MTGVLAVAASSFSSGVVAQSVTILLGPTEAAPGGGSFVFAADGGLSGTSNGSVVAGPWYNPITPSIGSAYWIRLTVLAGESPTSGNVGTWDSLATAQNWAWIYGTAGVRNSTVRIEIASDSSGSTVLATYEPSQFTFTIT